MKPFSIRSYSFQELALYYFPDSTGQCASARLRRWINYCTELRVELESLGYRRGQRVLTPNQVKQIVLRLGEPD